MEEKTNVMRMLDRKRIPYRSHYYGDTGAVSGLEVAKALGQDAASVYKTLVTVGKSGKNYVFVIPAAKELDLRKAAKCVGEKSIEMLKSRDLQPLTGYIHGGCSPIGMKKPFPTILDDSAQGLESIYISAGKVGYQVQLSPEGLGQAIRYQTAHIITEP